MNKITHRSQLIIKKTVGHKFCGIKLKQQREYVSNYLVIQLIKLDNENQ